MRVEAGCRIDEDQLALPSLGGGGKRWDLAQLAADKALHLQQPESIDEEQREGDRPSGHPTKFVTLLSRRCSEGNGGKYRQREPSWVEVAVTPAMPLVEWKKEVSKKSERERGDKHFHARGRAGGEMAV